jgi:hypothetical protein
MMAAALSTLPQMQADVAKAAHESDTMEREARAEADDAAFEREQREKIEGKSSGY